MTEDRIRVQVRVLPWLSELLAPGRQTAVVLDEELPPDASLRVLLARLAGRYAGFDRLIYDPRDDTMHEALVVTHNGRLVARTGALDLTLGSGDSVALIPAYSGG